MNPMIGALPIRDHFACHSDSQSDNTIDMPVSRLSHFTFVDAACVPVLCL